jgi:hypothetical protein
VCSTSVDVEGVAVATGEENSTIPPSLRVVKGFEREAVVVAVHGS